MKILNIKLGNADFCKDYNVKYAYQIGSMANGISSEKLVIAMGKAGTADRAMDYQIWYGRSMASFNSGVKGTYLEPLGKRSVVDIAHHIMKGAAYLFRIRMLEANGFRINPFYLSHKP